MITLTRIGYSTPYQSPDIINGYVMARCIRGIYYIKMNQYIRALNNLTIANVSPKWDTDIPVVILDI